MKPLFLAAISLSLLQACHHADSRSNELWGRVLSRGGELAEVRPERTNTTITPSTITVWGVMEVPDGSRMQAAYAGVDAIARSELLKVIRVRISDVMVSVESTERAQTTAFEHTVESVDGVMRASGKPLHGWERVQRADAIVLRVWARLSVPSADLDLALRASSLDPTGGTTARHDR